MVVSRSTISNQSVALVCGAAVATVGYLLLSRKSNGHNDGGKDVHESNTSSTAKTTSPGECDNTTIGTLAAPISDAANTARPTTPDFELPVDEALEDMALKNAAEEALAPAASAKKALASAKATIASKEETLSPRRKNRRSFFDDENPGDENQQHLANTREPTTLAVDENILAVMAVTKAANEALASAASVAAKKAAASRKKNNSRRKKSRGTAQRAAVREIRDFRKSQNGKK